MAARVEGGVPVGELRAETVTTFAAAVAAAVDGASPSDAVASRLIVGLVDIEARDAVLGWAAGDADHGLLALLVDLVGRAVEPFDAPVATALAWVAYARGDGALANVAVDRALDSDPGYSMALLIASSLEAGIHPVNIRAASSAVGGD